MVTEELCPFSHLLSEEPQGQCPCLWPCPSQGQPLTFHCLHMRLPMPTCSPEFEPQIGLQLIMKSRGPPAPSYWMLLLLLLSPPYIHQGWALGHIISTQSAQDPPARYLSSGPGQEPVAVMTFDLTKISKTSSSFEFRTWDPEGVIFYGDTNTEEDWFVLGLRDGRLEVQLHNPWARLTVGAGPWLDDGRWHQLVPALDGCLRRESWLGQQTQPSASASTGLRSCNMELQPGLFFPPGTRAEFRLQDIPQPHTEPWAFSLDLGLKLAAGSGHLLGLGARENSSWLSLHLQDQKVVLSSGAGPRLELPVTLGLPLQLKLAASTVVLKQGPKKEVFAMPTEGFASVLKLWTQSHGHLFLGALPGEDSSASFCLNGLWVQGQKLDMDQALSRSQDVWTHSCPQAMSSINDTDISN
ncbi:sex hormone-binding globulin isoform X3 [Fukomys damarensis]|uniref:sex hormone-binding globulin isoform X3 n=1 Tax=Fukomys damarensis TaxID=885580 RepID=UPI00053F933D|nr:sex hormone-binding globulin isoform X3 [Fukomys damarensis]